MKEPVISPDGKHMLVEGEWILLPGQEVNISDSAIAGNVSIESTVNVNVKNNNEKEIRNLAELCIERLNNGDMKSASELLNDAKKIDHSLATKLFETEYHLRIGEAYANIVENYLVKIASTKVTLDSKYFGYGVVSHNVEGNHESSALLEMLEIAFNNALHFLGEPDSLAPDGIPIDAMNCLDEFLNIDYDSEEFRNLKQIQFTSQPIENAIKQKYRIGLALECAAYKIMNDFMNISSDLPYDDVNKRFLDSKKPAEALARTRLYTTKVIAIAVHENYDLDAWKDEFDAKLIMLEFEQTRKKLLDEKFKRKNAAITAELMRTRAQSSDCFIATAAYGTKHEQKINVLRCWRDTKLMPSRGLSPLVRFYYKNSPPIANFISNKPFFRMLIRLALTPIILLIGLTVRSEYPSWTDKGNPE